LSLEVVLAVLLVVAGLAAVALMSLYDKNLEFEALHSQVPSEF
jgi:Tfp pilus assembly protein PilV